MIVSAFQPSSHDNCLVGHAVKAARFIHMGGPENDLPWHLNNIVTSIMI